MWDAIHRFAHVQPRIFARSVQARAGTSSVAISTSMAHVALSHILDHVVGGRILFPAAAMVEAVSSALHSMSTASPEASTHPTSAIANVTVPAPLVLTARPRDLITTTVHGSTGRIYLQSDALVQPRGSPTIHLSGFASNISGDQGGFSPTVTSHRGAVWSKMFLPRAPVPSQAVAVAAVASPLAASCQPGAFGVHPASLDNTTQVGSALAPSGGTSVMRVPAGLQLYMVGPHRGSRQREEGWALATITGVDASGTVTCSFNLRRTASSSAVLSDMYFKQIMRPSLDPPANETSAHAATSLYQLTWQASIALGEPVHAKASLRVSTRSRMTVWSSKGYGRIQVKAGATPIAAAAASVQFLQSMPAQGHVALTTRASQSDPPQPAPTSRSLRIPLQAASMSAILKVASQEMPAVRSRFEDTDMGTCGSVAPTGAEAADAFGTCFGRGAAHVPRLIPDHNMAGGNNPAAGGVEWQRGSYVVVGGLGDVGRVVCAHVASSESSDVVVLTRSASGAPVPGALTAAQGVVTVVSCDACNGSDVEQLQRARHAEECPVKGILHAGGVLKDALIGKQTLARLRRVVAPKLHAAQGVVGVTWGMPLAVVSLFSSLSALLGTPGQANYAAGNAALNQLSCALQHQGPSREHRFWCQHDGRHHA